MRLKGPEIFILARAYLRRFYRRESIAGFRNSVLGEAKYISSRDSRSISRLFKTEKIVFKYLLVHAPRNVHDIPNLLSAFHSSTHPLLCSLFFSFLQNPHTPSN